MHNVQKQTAKKGENMKVIEVRVPHITSPKVYIHESKKAFKESLLSELEYSDYSTQGKSVKELMDLVNDFHAYYTLTLTQAKHIVNDGFPIFHDHQRYKTFCEIRKSIEE